MNNKDYIGDLILLRGLPGSGKTTLGSVILAWPSTDKPDVLSADDFFTDENGVYNFDPKKLKDAHNDCEMRCSQKMKMGTSRIVVANTFTEEWEMKPYYDLAERYSYRVHSLIVENRHGNTSVHNVPDEAIVRMKNRFTVSL